MTTQSQASAGLQPLPGRRAALRRVGVGLAAAAAAAGVPQALRAEEGVFNRSSQHWAVGWIVDARSRFQPEFSNQAFSEA